MTIPSLPAQGEDPWYNKRAAFDEAIRRGLVVLRSDFDAYVASGGGGGGGGGGGSGDGWGNVVIVEPLEADPPPGEIGHRVLVVRLEPEL